MVKFLASEVGFGIISSLIIIFATHFLKKLFKTSTARKRCTPLITLGLGIGASILYYLTIKYGTLAFGEVQAYISIATFGMEIAVAATGVYIIVKRIFGKSSDEDITLEELFKTADSVLPQGLLLVSNFIGGDVPTAETLYNKVRAEVYTSLTEKKETVEQAISKINILLNGWTNDASVDTLTQAKLLVQAVKTELDMAAKAAEEALKAQEAIAEKKKEEKK
jgi:hypothetical protein